MPRDNEGPNPLQWFLLELERMPGCEVTKARVLDLLRSMTGERMRLTRRDLVRPKLLALAGSLLRAGFTPTQARRELVARCGFSNDTAERLVTAALSARAVAAAAQRAGHGAPDNGEPKAPSL